MNLKIVYAFAGLNIVACAMMLGAFGLFVSTIGWLVAFKVTVWKESK